MRIFILSTVLLLLSHSGFGADRTEELLSKVKGKAELALARSQNSNAKKSLGQIVSAANILNAKAVDGSTADYIVTLEYNLTAIEAAVDDLASDQAIESLRRAATDLSIKVAHAQRAVGVGSSLAARVKVSVRTRRGGVEIPGFLVAANPLTVANESPPRFPFANPTNEAERTLPPGEFSIWLVQNGKELYRRTVPIGGTGEITQTIHFNLP